jgi:urease accessory protein
MDRDAKAMRGVKPVIFADLKSEKGKELLLDWLTREYLFV